ncbi:type II toxin-antitoxin system HipA family toxin [Nocardia sp. NPDC058658]|uniref:type II toxin-antitoxin system HipA family toxin n=1 Tax=Nocardia sp. NPDC058658 TaxID=3346580 RepID=UPI00364A691A
MTGSDDHVLYVVMNGRVIGDIQRSSRRRMRLRYADHPSGRFTPLSVSMQGPTGRYRESVLAPWLEGLLPDRPETLRQWRRRFGIADDNSSFSLLRHVGEDVAGAAQFVRPDRLDFIQERQGELAELGSSQIAEMLRRAKADLPISGTDDSSGKFSLAGAQAKIALHRTDDGWSDPVGAIPSTHIIKPPIPAMLDQDLAEAVTLRTAAALGLRTASCVIEEFDDERGIVVARYDRIRRNDQWQRVHQEDMCQAMAIWPTRKYQSQGGPGAEMIADLIRASSHRPEEDNRRFAQALVFNWLICGTDAHARNYSLLLSGESVRLAPLYDLNSHLAFSDGSGNDLSMSVNQTYRAEQIAMTDWARFAPAVHVEPDWLREEIDRQSNGLMDAMTDATQCDDIARYNSPTITRLLENAERWIGRLSRPRRQR